MLGYPPRFYLSSFVLDTLALNPGSLIVPQAVSYVFYMFFVKKKYYLKMEIVKSG